MSLSAWEQQALDSIKDGLAGTDPKLAALLATFDRLASGEGMPAREKVQAGRRRGAHRPRRKRQYPRCGTVRRHVRRTCARPGFQQIALLLCLLATVGLTTVALALSRTDSRDTCTTPWPAVCAAPSPVHSPHPAAHKRAANQAPHVIG